MLPNCCGVPVFDRSRGSVGTPTIRSLVDTTVYLLFQWSYLMKTSRKPIPVGAAVYQALADFNRACEQAAAGVDTLLRFGFFRKAQLETLKFRIAGACAEINRECMETLDS